ncbi:MAG: MFS transporter, partial [Hymenobacter sp.]
IAAGLGYASPQWVGAGLALAGLLLGVVLYIRQHGAVAPVVDVEAPEEVLA